MKTVALLAGLLGGTAAVFAYSNRKEIEARAKTAVHVLRGRPLIWRVDLIAPPVLNLAPGQQNVLLADLNLNGSNGMQMGIQR